MELVKELARVTHATVEREDRGILSLCGRTVYVLRANGVGPILGLEMPPFDGGKRLLLTDVFGETR